MNNVEGWEEGRLGDLCSIEIGRTPSRNSPEFWDAAKETSNLWASIKDLSRSPVYDTGEYVSDLGVKRSNMKLQQPGTLLLSFKLSIGRVAFAGTPLYTNEAIASLKSEKINLEYLFHGLRYWDLLQDVDQAIKGATLNKDKLKRISFNFPASDNEQAQIALLLSTVERSIEQTEELIAKQTRVKTGLMQELLVRGIDDHGRVRSEKPHQFKDSSLGRIPVEWDVKRLEELVDEEITYGIVQAGPHVEGGVPYIRTGDMAGETIEDSQLLRTSAKIAAAYKRSKVSAGDIVFALRATVGKVLPLPEELDGANLTQGTAKISPRKSVDSTFMLWAMQTHAVHKQIQLHQKGTTFMEITLGDLRSIEIAVPKSLDEQRAIAEKLVKHNEVRLHYMAHKEKLRSLRSALMQELLSGRKRIGSLLSELEGEFA